MKNDIMSVDDVYIIANQNREFKEFKEEFKEGTFCDMF